jgi:N-acetyl-gamma-glutamyl-phosphate reductase
MIRAGIVGVSGYSGLIALELLLKHKDVRITYISANNNTGAIESIWPHLKGKTQLECTKFNLKKAIELCDVLFLAVPHKIAMKITPDLLAANKKIIDISADYRLKDTNQYKEWYGDEHTDKMNLAEAVYGLPELYREKIKKAKLIANPGCYPTAALLSLIPLISTHTNIITDIIIDAKSGVSGAGRKVAEELMHSQVNENFKAYKVLKHQHTPEINQCLTEIAHKPIHVTFTAHLLPVNRGIQESIYVRTQNPISEQELYDLYTKFYKTEKFVRILKLGEQPELKNVTGTNFCDIGLAAKDTMLIITSAIDNLVKGASGQAVQNMNILYNFNETEALL